jgi:hypothetical protein
VKIDSVQGGIQTYSDTPPYGLVYYFVEAKPPHPCQVTKAQTNYNTSRSNRANTSAFLGVEIQANECSVSVFPNPSSDIINVSIEDNNAEDLNYELYSISGKLILHSNTYKFVNGLCGFVINSDKNQLPEGMYLLKIIIDNRVIIRKLIIN